MVSKKVILDVISKYSLGGLIEKSKWSIKDGKFKTIVGGSGYKGMVEYNSDFSLKEGDYAIWQTPQLVKCLNILDENILIEASYKNGIPSHFNIADTNYEIIFSLSDPETFDDKVPTSKPPAPDASFEISDEFFTRFIKSTDILSGETNPLFSLKSAEGFTGSELVFNVQKGQISIDFAIEADIKQEIKPFYFNAELLRIILKANKNYSNGSFSVYIPSEKVLLIKLEFETETGIKTKYQINNTIK